MIEWNKYFDQIYCLFYTGQMERMDDIRSELQRVGIFDSGIFRFFYNTDNPFYANVMATMKKDNRYQQLNFLRCFNPYYGHYCMIKEAYERGLKKVLFLESDAQFMTDIDKMEKIIHDIPCDHDMILFDRSIKKQILEEQQKVNENFYRFNSSNGQYCLFTAVSLSDRMMKWILDRQEFNFGCTDDIWNDDDVYMNSLNRYISLRHIVIQRDYGNKASSINSFRETIYKRDHVNLGDFE